MDGRMDGWTGSALQQDVRSSDWWAAKGKMLRLLLLGRLPQTLLCNFSPNNGNYSKFLFFKILLFFNYFSLDEQIFKKNKL